jgi:hypothetical protein
MPQWLEPNGAAVLNLDACGLNNGKDTTCEQNDYLQMNDYYGQMQSAMIPPSWNTGVIIAVPIDPTAMMTSTDNGCAAPTWIAIPQVGNQVLPVQMCPPQSPAAAIGEVVPNITQPHGMYMHHSDGGLQSVQQQMSNPPMNGQQQVALASMPEPAEQGWQHQQQQPVPEPAEQGWQHQQGLAKLLEGKGKIFMHDSNGQLRHVAQCSRKDDTGNVEVNVINSQRNRRERPEQSNVRKTFASSGHHPQELHEPPQELQAQQQSPQAASGGDISCRSGDSTTIVETCSTASSRSLASNRASNNGSDQRPSTTQEAAGEESHNAHHLPARPSQGRARNKPSPILPGTETCAATTIQRRPQKPDAAAASPGPSPLVLHSSRGASSLEQPCTGEAIASHSSATTARLDKGRRKSAVGSAAVKMGQSIALPSSNVKKSRQLDVPAQTASWAMADLAKIVLRSTYASIAADMAEVTSPVPHATQPGTRKAARRNVATTSRRQERRSQLHRSSQNVPAGAPSVPAETVLIQNNACKQPRQKVSHFPRPIMIGLAVVVSMAVAIGCLGAGKIDDMAPQVAWHPFAGRVGRVVQMPLGSSEMAWPMVPLPDARGVEGYGDQSIGAMLRRLDIDGARAVSAAKRPISSRQEDSARRNQKSARRGRKGMASRAQDSYSRELEAQVLRYLSKRKNFRATPDVQQYSEIDDRDSFSHPQAYEDYDKHMWKEEEVPPEPTPDASKAAFIRLLTLLKHDIE